jgi:Gly-Xaa carboxypeptidase
VLGFGQDEEIGGHIGAFHISRLIEQTYGTNGLAMIVDEGGMDIKSLYSTEFAAVGVAEKGGIVSLRVKR